MLDNLISWYKQNKRDLPFRKTNDPYKIWLSEIILQQTRVEQGLAYYDRFVHRFPTVADLAKATLDEVMQLWQGLGYYSRARNLLFAAKQVMSDFDGNFPRSYKHLIKLKGIGEYTAAAIASISNNEPVAAVDGNVYRVVSRLMTIKTPIDSVKGKKEIKELANRFLDKKYPGEFNQGMMEVGALICKPKNPECNRCPLSNGCLAFANGRQLNFPVKEKKIKQKIRYLYLYIVKVGNSVFINRRKEGDIWEGLYQFPILESKESLPDQKLAIPEFIDVPSNYNVSIDKISEEITHILSHQILKVKFIHLKVIEINFSLDNEYMKVELEQLAKFAMPRLITRYLENTEI